VVGVSSGEDPLKRHPFEIGLASVVALVLLRLTLGWHFCYQGIAKLEDPQFSSAPFLTQAKGPLGDLYRSLLGDWDGRQALSKEKRPSLSQRFDEYLNKFKDRYRPGPEQVAAAEQMLAARKAQTALFIEENEKDFDAYLHELDRLKTAKDSPTAKPVAADHQGPEPAKPSRVWSYPPYQQKRIWDKQTELQGQLKGWLKQLDAYYVAFKQDLDDLLDEEQRVRAKNEPAPPADKPTGVEQVDKMVSYGVTAIGVCLLLGLFTRLASFAGALFLLSIVLAQPDWPGLYPSPHPSVGRSMFVNKEFVEMMAMFALATTRVGRWGGLDFFVHYCFVRPLFGRRETTLGSSQSTSAKR
jgi:uncharacterized membrane protein YphA (DoxX/SURF4 family)